MSRAGLGRRLKTVFLASVFAVGGTGRHHRLHTNTLFAVCAHVEGRADLELLLTNVRHIRALHPSDTVVVHMWRGEDSRHLQCVASQVEALGAHFLAGAERYEWGCFRDVLSSPMPGEFGFASAGPGRRQALMDGTVGRYVLMQHSLVLQRALPGTLDCDLLPILDFHFHFPAGGTGPMQLAWVVGQLDRAGLGGDDTMALLSDESRSREAGLVACCGNNFIIAAASAAQLLEAGLFEASLSEKWHSEATERLCGVVAFKGGCRSSLDGSAEHIPRGDNVIRAVGHYPLHFQKLYGTNFRHGEGLSGDVDHSHGGCPRNSSAGH